MNKIQNYLKKKKILYLYLSLYLVYLFSIMIINK